MIEPGLSLQTAVRAVLIADAAITAQVDPASIRTGSIRQEGLPAIMLAPAKVEILGRASGHQIVASVTMILHLWTVADGSAQAQVIAGAMLSALMDAPAGDGFQIDAWDRPDCAWLPDPDPAQSRCHAVFALRAVLRWRVA